MRLESQLSRMNCQTFSTGLSFDNISRDFGSDMTPIQVFPPMTMVMVEWVEAISGMSGEIDRETAQTLTDSISELSDCLRRLLQRPLPVPDRS